MSEGIIVAIIAAGASIIGNLIVSRNARKKEADERERVRKTEAIERAKRDQFLDDNLKQINRKLDEHNGYASKFADISADIRVLRTEIENIKGK